MVLKLDQLESQTMRDASNYVDHDHCECFKDNMDPSIFISTRFKPMQNGRPTS